MQDGQIYNRYVRICVPDIEITEEMNPVLTLHYRKNKESDKYPIPEDTDEIKYVDKWLKNGIVRKLHEEWDKGIKNIKIN